MAIAMGIGALGGPNITFKRKFRWTFEVTNICQNSGNFGIDPQWCKVASRPNLDIEETEINFLNGKMFIPGKGTWQEMTVTYYDVGGITGSSGLDNLYRWLATVYNFKADQQHDLPQASKWGDYGANVVLTLYDGGGNPMEAWTLKNTWPKAVNFGELDYSSSEEVTVELTLRYAWVTLNRNYCNDIFPDPCITPC